MAATVNVVLANPISPPFQKSLGLAVRQGDYRVGETIAVTSTVAHALIAAGLATPTSGTPTTPADPATSLVTVEQLNTAVASAVAAAVAGGVTPAAPAAPAAPATPPAASAVSVNPSGLAVVTGTNVQAALAQIDTWTKGRPTHESGTFAQRPADGARPNGSTYFADDINLGTPYRMRAGTWRQDGAGVGDSGGRELAYANIAVSPATANAPDSALHDVTGLQVGFVAGVRPVKVRTSVLVGVGLGSASSGSIRRITLAVMQVNADTSVTQRDGTGYTIAVATGNAFQARLICEWRFQPVQGQTYTFKTQLQSNVAGLALTTFGQDFGTESFIEAVER